MNQPFVQVFLGPFFPLPPLLDQHNFPKILLQNNTDHYKGIFNFNAYYKVARYAIIFIYLYTVLAMPTVQHPAWSPAIIPASESSTLTTHLVFQTSKLEIIT